MGWLRKKAKKVFKSIKKVFKKIGRAFGKLGVLGQIGMMFLMPYAAGALGSFFGTAGKLAKWSSTLLSKSGIGAKALGHGLNMINKAGTFAGKVYTTVTQGINNGIDRVVNFAKGKGFTLSEGKTSIFAKDVSTPSATVVESKVPESLKQVQESTKPFDITTASPEELTKKLMKTDVGVSVPSVPKTFKLDLEAMYRDATLEKSIAKELGTESLLTPDVSITSSKIPEFDVSKLNLKADAIADVAAPKPTVMERIKGIPGEIKKGIKEFDVSQSVRTGLEKGVESGVYLPVKQGIAKAAGYEDPTPVYNYINNPDILQNLITDTNYKAMDYSLQQQGNTFTLPSMQYANNLNNLVEQDNATYQNYMAEYSASEMGAFDNYIRQGYY